MGGVTAKEPTVPVPATAISAATLQANWRALEDPADALPVLPRDRVPALLAAVAHVGGVDITKSDVEAMLNTYSARTKSSSLEIFASFITLSVVARISE